MSETTTYYSLTLPVVGGDAADWAAFTNENWVKVDTALHALSLTVSAPFTADTDGLVPHPGANPGDGTPMRFLGEDGTFRNVETDHLVGDFTGPYVVGYAGTISLPVNVTGQIVAEEDNRWLGRQGGELAFYKRSHAETVGDGAQTDFLIEHNLGTEDVIVQVRSEIADFTGKEYYTEQGPLADALFLVSTRVVDANTVSVIFPEAPASVRVMILAV